MWIFQPIFMVTNKIRKFYYQHTSNKATFFLSLFIPHAGKIPETDRTLRNRSPNTRLQLSHTANQLMPFNGKFTLTMNDREHLIMIGDNVDDLRKRLEAHCPNLTTRTKLYLNQLDAMRDIADCW